MSNTTENGVVEAFYPVIRSRIGPALLLLSCAACGAGDVVSSVTEPPARSFESSELVGSWAVEAETATACWERGEVIELEVLFALPATNAAAVEGLLGPLPIPLVGVVNLLEGSFQIVGASARRSEDSDRVLIIAWMGGTIVPDSGSLSGNATLDFEGFIQTGVDQQPFDCRGPVTLSKSGRR